METNPIIEMEQVSCKAGYKYLLKDITWRVQPGEHWVVFGMNGSGKTTLLSIAAGFKAYTAGMVKLFGTAPDSENVLQMRKKVGWVSSSFFDKYYTRESVMDIVLSGKYGTLGIESDITLADRKRAKELLRALHIEYCMNATFDMLSKGERQNVMIARALFSSPEVLILDEPCAGLDVYNREDLFQTLTALAEDKHIAIIYVTHYVEEILPIFKNCLLLRKGHIFAQGKTEELLCDDTMSQFLGHEAHIELHPDGKRTLHIAADKSALVNLIE